MVHRQALGARNITTTRAAYRHKSLVVKNAPSRSHLLHPNFNPPRRNKAHDTIGSPRDTMGYIKDTSE